MCHLTGKPQTPRPFKLPDPQKVQTPQLIITKIKGRADLRRSYNFIDSRYFFCFSIWEKFCSSSFSDHEASYYIPTRKSLSSSSRLHLNRFDNENLERKMSDEAMASRRRPQHAFGRSVLTFTISRPCNLKCSSESPSTQHHCVVESELKKCISTYSALV